MRYVVTLLAFVLFSSPTFADDSQTNPVAKKIKNKLQRKVTKQFDDYQGYCDVMIEMEHKGSKASIKRVSGTGDRVVCRYVKSNLKIGQRFRYKVPEKYIRLHITTN
ncbi:MULTISPECIES: hypothetical protein [Vibrio]|uniref:Uncharacterized protein n=1 Tax=Vibrio natriegens NBRC 15636 = ATCC 14048 = DSM 759 TaxID=1219067 RepID=A0AAN0Y2T5_VIBNA|nr:hypothetical protein [Vibrio natriegens]MEE3877896.1 hypothetical protein [Vibrio sp. YYF0003]ALR15492.1 hypothetical protein PN96_05660 [Vibrio natriegens NBRC 15636 = ATCC 14048 = DSM 759]ANQ12648.1 hypothetical protein BA890_07685 [Vibrio natriegens NBRC 15636 = ATCC 14048 = DSM 759]EPM42237.1 hypothetical protein M272_03210 [Vibrio natriegens NBRC 15636 = ATCC 14048 = DSM 759]MDX6027044.1 hypothetical protein [Vibrio natriegens NBRC 15636 = ATCC 14048 = DSM 759]